MRSVTVGELATVAIAVALWVAVIWGFDVG